MNLVSLIGRVVKEVEVQQLQPSGRVCLIIPSRCKMYTEITAMILIIHTLSKWSLGAKLQNGSASLV